VRCADTVPLRKHQVVLVTDDGKHPECRGVQRTAHVPHAAHK
jgi:hypothetical protein